MYCIKCGVELSDSEKSCPLCGLKPYHPEITRTIAPKKYPDYEAPKTKINRKTVMFILTLITFVCTAQLFICDISITGRVTWSLYAGGGLVLFYVIAMLPLWFKKPNPVIFVPCDFAAVTVYILTINLMVGGDWFLSFAFPIAVVACLITTTVVTLRRYVRGGFFFIYGGTLIACGAYVCLIEFFLHITFGIKFYFWSFYPLTAGILLGLAMMIIGICRPVRQALEKKFFI